MRSRFICAMRTEYMRYQTTMVSATSANAGQKIRRVSMANSPVCAETAACHAAWAIASCGTARIACRSDGAAIDQQLLDLPDRLGRVESFRTGLRAVHDGVAAVQLERI